MNDIDSITTKYPHTGLSCMRVSQVGRTVIGTAYDYRYDKSKMLWAKNHTKFHQKYQGLWQKFAGLFRNYPSIRSDSNQKKATKSFALNLLRFIHLTYTTFKNQKFARVYIINSYYNKVLELRKEVIVFASWKVVPDAIF